MTQRGRKSTAALTSIIGTGPTRLRPPSKFYRAERVVWCDIVNSLPADYFRPADVPLLMNYCRFAVQADRLGEHLDDPKAVRLLRGVSASMALIATKLRLCPSARMRNTSAQLRDTRTTNRPWE